MRHHFPLLLVGSALVTFIATSVLAGVQGPPPGDVGKVYDSLCANCHGPTLAGGQGPSLVDAEWIHGETDADITRVIRDGVPTTPMASFRAAL